MPGTIIVATTVYPDSLLTDLQARHPDSKVVYRPSPEDAPSEQELKDAVALYGFVPPANLSSIEQTPNLKLVQLSSAGYAHYENTDFYKSVGESSPLILANASGIHVVVIAEHVVAVTLSLYHAIPRFILSARNNSEWISQAKVLNAERFGIRELRGRRAGVLGYGHIGREIGRMFKVLGMDVVAATRSGKKASVGGFLIEGTGDHHGDIPSAWYETGSKESMHAFYSSCDVVVNTLPSSKATVGFVDEAAFRSMKDTAVFVNIGRGDTVDQDALVTALQAGSPTAIYRRAPADETTSGAFQIGAASVDVTTPEPLPSDSPLYTLENVILTPHMSGMTEIYHKLGFDLLSQNIKRVVDDGKGALNAWHGKGE